jgi:hypothetical protein
MAQKKEPAQRFRLGNISAAIWTNTNGNGEVWFNVEVTRRYRDEETWKDATTFRRDDLPIVALAAIRAYDWIWRQKLPAQPDAEAERMTNANGCESEGLSQACREISSRRSCDRPRSRSHFVKGGCF